MESFKELITENSVDGYDMKQLIENLADNIGIDLSKFRSKVIKNKVIYETMNEKEVKVFIDIKNAFIDEISDKSKKYIDVYDIKGDGVKSWHLSLTYDRKWYNDYLDNYM